MYVYPSIRVYLSLSASVVLFITALSLFFSRKKIENRRPGQLRDIHLYRFFVENSLDEEILSERQWKDLERYSDLTQIDPKDVTYTAAGDITSPATWGKSTPCRRVPKQFADFYDATSLVSKNKTGLLRVNPKRPKGVAKKKKVGAAKKINKRRASTGSSKRKKKKKKEEALAKSETDDSDDDSDFEPAVKRSRGKANATPGKSRLRGTPGKKKQRTESSSRSSSAAAATGSRRSSRARKEVKYVFSSGDEEDF
jgi:hypothetical protein